MQQQTKKRPMRIKRRKKACPFKAAKMDSIDYKDIETLKRFVTERGKLLPRRVTGVCAQYQRLLSQAVKRARLMALLPFSCAE
jgi:small subunit ribosomal protein S18